jgi:hypothetical protein
VSGSKKLVRGAKSGAVVGTMGLGRHGKSAGSAAQSVYDGDTLHGSALANVPVRFLGVDTPELKIALPDAPDDFIALDDERWQRFLANRDVLKRARLSKGLAAHLASRLGERTALNHHEHAVAAMKSLEAFVKEDLTTRYAGDKQQFQFFLYYAHDVVDRYGRFLAFINVDLPNSSKTERPLTYNERQLGAGCASPYFIWPNLDPFMKATNLLNAAFSPADVKRVANRGALGRARKMVAQARRKKLGIYAAGGPLLLEAFEIRFLARQAPPDRWVIDLSADDGRLIEPERYYAIKHAENRLFLPPEYVPLFARAGWRGAAI